MNLFIVGWFWLAMSAFSLIATPENDISMYSTLILCWVCWVGDRVIDTIKGYK